MTTHPQVLLDRYEVGRLLGAGGMAEVFEGRDRLLARRVAIKVLQSQFARDPSFLIRFKREAQAAASLSHPNIVGVYDTGTEDGTHFIVMEYVDGRTLKDVIRAEAPLYPDRAAEICADVCAALGAAHARGLVHRDVKPSNIILDEGGYPHLIDFGIARATGDVTLTAAGMVVGTPDYMAPEVAAGKPASPASDAWQLAATVSYALAGTPPRGHRDGAIAAMLAAAQGQPCNQLPTHTAHRGLLEQALHPDPARRPGLPEVQAELDRWLAANGQQPDGPVTERLQRPPAPTWPTEEHP